MLTVPLNEVFAFPLFSWSLINKISPLVALIIISFARILFSLIPTL